MLLRRSCHRLVGDVGVLVLMAGMATVVIADDWPEWRGQGRLGVWNDTGIVDDFPAAGLPVSWRVPIHSGYAGPAVAGGRVFVTDAERLQANDHIERVLALDEMTGEVLWTRDWTTSYAGLQPFYAVGPRATPTVDDDRVYVLGAMGNLLALDVETGAMRWQKDFVADFDTAVPAWGMTGAPLVDGPRLICLVGGEPGAKVVALDKLTGAELWRALSSDWEPGYAPPIIIEAAGVRQLIIFHPRGVTSLNPVTGYTYWDIPYDVQLGMSIPTPVHSGPYLFITSQWDGGLMLKLDETSPGATVLWDEKDHPTLTSVMSTPVIQGDYVYGVDTEGELLCVDVATGRVVWKTEALLTERAPHATAFFVRHGDRYFINNDRGELVIAKLSPEGYEEIDRTTLIEPTHPYARRREFPAVLWSHAAYANRHILIRNDDEIVRFSLATEP